MASCWEILISQIKQPGYNRRIGYGRLSEYVRYIYQENGRLTIQGHPVIHASTSRVLQIQSRLWATIPF